MAANKQKAQLYINEVTRAESEIRKKHGIDARDVHHILRVNIEDSLKYDLHEDDD